MLFRLLWFITLITGIILINISNNLKTTIGIILIVGAAQINSAIMDKELLDKIKKALLEAIRKEIKTQ